MKLNKKFFSYNHKKIVVYPQIFTPGENLMLYDLIVNCNFQRTNIDISLHNNIDRDVKWWSVIDPRSEISQIINPKYISSINDFLWKEVSIASQYINYANNSTVDLIHADEYSNADRNTYTILHFANHIWNSDWHGHLLFFDDTNTSIIYGIIPSPGTIVVFDSRINHSATPCNIKAEFPRYTIATKIFRKN